eukprot:INCI17876.1.p1 GENE.INCI17876.1~~INCI17876.1.p1  ORF type:complete len:777 (-),score=172.16 INCI17876.1:794-3124(-)
MSANDADQEALAILAQAVLVDEDAEIVEALLSDNSELLALSDQPLLHAACSRGSVDVAAALIRYGADVLGCDPRFRRPLHCAVCASRVEARLPLVKLLLAQHARTNDLRRVMLSRDSQGRTCLHAAVSAPRGGNSQVVQSLLDHKASADVASLDKFPHLQQPVVLASMGGDIATLQVLLAAKAYVNAQSRSSAEGGNSAVPIICAAQNGWLEGVQALVAAKAYVDARGDDDGMTAAHWSFQMGHTECGRWLLTQGAASRVLRDKNGCTPLDYDESSDHDAEESKTDEELPEEQEPNGTHTEHGNEAVPTRKHDVQEKLPAKERVRKSKQLDMFNFVGFDDDDDDELDDNDASDQGIGESGNDVEGSDDDDNNNDSSERGLMSEADGNEMQYSDSSSANDEDDAQYGAADAREAYPLNANRPDTFGSPKTRVSSRPKPKSRRPLSPEKTKLRLMQQENAVQTNRSTKQSQKRQRGAKNVVNVSAGAASLIDRVRSNLTVPVSFSQTAVVEAPRSRKGLVSGRDLDFDDDAAEAEAEAEAAAAIEEAREAAAALAEESGWVFHTESESESDSDHEPSDASGKAEPVPMSGHKKQSKKTRRHRRRKAKNSRQSVRDSVRSAKSEHPVSVESRTMLPDIRMGINSPQRIRQEQLDRKLREQERLASAAHALVHKTSAAKLPMVAAPLRQRSSSAPVQTRHHTPTNGLGPAAATSSSGLLSPRVAQVAARKAAERKRAEQAANRHHQASSSKLAMDHAHKLLSELGRISPKKIKSACCNGS